MLSKELKISNAILDYESKFDGWLKTGYEENKEFLNDLNDEIKKNGTSELLEYYKIHLISMNDTNSTIEKRLEIGNIISLLENQ